MIRASFNALPMHTIGADVLPEVSIDSFKMVFSGTPACSAGVLAVESVAKAACYGVY